MNTTNKYIADMFPDLINDPFTECLLWVYDCEGHRARNHTVLLSCGQWSIMHILKIRTEHGLYHGFMKGTGWMSK